MKKIISLLFVAILMSGISVSDSCCLNAKTTSKTTRTSKSTGKRSSSTSSSSKRWTGAKTLSEFKSKLPGTSWGATKKRGDLYVKYDIKSDRIYITTYLDSNFTKKFGEGWTEYIDEWREKDGKVYAVVAYRAGDDKKDWSTVPTVLGFKIGSPDAYWAAVGEVIPLKQIL